MLTISNAHAMLSMQTQMNAKVNPNWLSAGFPFLRAVVIEGAEGIEHHGMWKWWKKGMPNIEQLRLELVDIFHFTLSALLVARNGCIASTAEDLIKLAQSEDFTAMFDGKMYQIDALDTVEKLELLIGLSVSRRINLVLFEAIMLDCEMSWDDLYRQYVGKNVLNFFRQDNGYREGGYQKTWSGREDNEHLVEIVSSLDVDEPNFRELIYVSLSERYAVALHGDVTGVPIH